MTDKDRPASFGTFERVEHDPTHRPRVTLEQHRLEPRSNAGAWFTVLVVGFLIALFVDFIWSHMP